MKPLFEFVSVLVAALLLSLPIAAVALAVGRGRRMGLLSTGGNG